MRILAGWTSVGPSGQSESQRATIDELLKPIGNGSDANLGDHRPFDEKLPPPKGERYPSSRLDGPAVA